MSASPLNHWPLHTMRNENPGSQAVGLRHASYPRLWLSQAVQFTGVLIPKPCRLVAYTGYADIYEADVPFSDKNSLPVVAKAFRGLPDRGGKEQINEMVRMLQDIRLTVGHDHEHIAPVWQASVSSAESTLPAIITPHYRNGNVLEYARGKPDSDFLEMVYQAASALSYIHAKGDIHGNFCPENICIADDGKVRITDVGVDALVHRTGNRSSNSVPKNWMYKAREELELGARTMQTDTYSFATTVYCIYMLKPPFASKTRAYGKHLMQIVDQGHDGIFGNSKPAQMSDSLWEIIRLCWAIHPIDRPPMVEVESKLRKMCGLNAK